MCGDGCSYVKVLLTSSTRRLEIKLSSHVLFCPSAQTPPLPSTRHWPWLWDPLHVDMCVGVHMCACLYRISFQTQCFFFFFLILIDDAIYLWNNNLLIPPTTSSTASLSPRHSPCFLSPSLPTSMKMILETKWDLKFCVWQAAWWKGFIAGLDPWKFYANNTAGQAI